MNYGMTPNYLPRLLIEMCIEMHNELTEDEPQKIDDRVCKAFRRLNSQ